MIPDIYPLMADTKVANFHWACLNDTTFLKNEPICRTSHTPRKTPEFCAPNEKSFGWEWFFILLRTILRAAANDFMPCASSTTHTMRLNAKRVHILHTNCGSIHYGELSSSQPSPVLHGDASVSVWAPKSHRTVWARRESIHWKKFSFPRIVFPLHYLCYRENRMRLGIAKLEKLRFSFVSALAFRYLCTRYETEAYFFPIHLFVYGVSRHSTNACR